MFLGNASLPPGLRIYAIGDVHGRLDCLEDLVDRISADLNRHPAQAARIVMLGDYVDRGPDAKGVIDLLMKLPERFDLVCLRGNHDDRFLSLMTDPDEYSIDFLRNGGWETLGSYGISASPMMDDIRLSRAVHAGVPQSHRRFLSGLELSHVAGDFFFCHAGVRPGVELSRQAPYDLMWIRYEFLDYPGDFGKVVVHGHTPGDDVEVRPNRINVDTMAFRSGVLSALVLEGASHRFLQTGVG